MVNFYRLNERAYLLCFIWIVTFNSMDIEGIIGLGILTHATLGAVALLFGAVALLAKKGSKIHKGSGRIFYLSMVVSAVLSLLIATSPGHENPFLFSIGLFSLYFLVMGLRSLRYKRGKISYTLDMIIASLIAVIGVVMIMYPLVFEGKMNIVLVVFGTAAFVFGLRDLLRFRSPAKLRESWLQLHLGKMTGGYIAAVSAFLVVNQILPGLWNWFLPSVVGSIYIAYWMRRVRKVETGK